jgi:hypothetical protein
MAGTDTLQVQAETRGAVPEGAVSLAVHRISSLLRQAPEPVLFAPGQAGDGRRPGGGAARSGADQRRPERAADPRPGRGGDDA